MLGQAGVAFLWVPRVRIRMPAFLSILSTERATDAGRASWDGGTRGLDVWSAWEGPGQPPRHPPSGPCTSVLPACLRLVRGSTRQCLQTEVLEADASVGKALATSPSVRVTPVHTGECDVAPFCFLGILMTSPG